MGLQTNDIEKYSATNCLARYVTRLLHLMFCHLRTACEFEHNGIAFDLHLSGMITVLR